LKNNKKINNKVSLYDCKKTISLLGDYFDELCNDDVIEAIKVHINECEHCREEHDKLKQMIYTMKMIEPVEIPADLHERIMRRFDEAEADEKVMEKPMNFKFPFTLAAACLMVVVISASLYFNPAVRNQYNKKNVLEDNDISLFTENTDEDAAYNTEMQATGTGEIAILFSSDATTPIFVTDAPNASNAITVADSGDNAVNGQERSSGGNIDEQDSEFIMIHDNNKNDENNMGGADATDGTEQIVEVAVEMYPLSPIDENNTEILVDSITPITGMAFGAPKTMDFFETEFSEPMVNSHSDYPIMYEITIPSSIDLNLGFLKGAAINTSIINPDEIIRFTETLARDGKPVQSDEKTYYYFLIKNSFLIEIQKEFNELLRDPSIVKIAPESNSHIDQSSELGLYVVVLY